jgi:type IV pilus assembly protein PilE
MRLQQHMKMRGFTLIELMVVVVIASILLAVAVPSYISQIRQSRRTDARTAVLDLAGREERYFSTNSSSYTNAAANLGYAGFGNPAGIVGSGYYYINNPVCTPACAPSGAAAPSFSVIVLPVPGTSQAQDTACQGFAVDSTGEQWAKVGGAWVQNTPGASAAVCWSN